MNVIKKQKGFTLIEILVAVVILGVLAGLVVPRLTGRTESARKKAAFADVSGGIALAIDLFEVDMGRYPSTLTELIEAPSGSEFWEGPYLKKGLPKDPWGSEYVYKVPGSKYPDSYDLYSLGPDSQDETGDEIYN